MWNIELEGSPASFLEMVRSSFAMMIKRAYTPPGEVHGSDAQSGPTNMDGIRYDAEGNIID